MWTKGLSKNYGPELRNVYCGHSIFFNEFEHAFSDKLYPSIQMHMKEYAKRQRSGEMKVNISEKTPRQPIFDLSLQTGKDRKRLFMAIVKFSDTQNT